MTTTQFNGTYLHIAQLVSAGTGINAYVLLAQWACETDYGNVVVGNNLGNIRCSSTTFCQYATLDDFAAACIATWHNGYYSDVLLAQGVSAQLAAICASPWDAGHYGGSLAAFYTAPDMPVILRHTSNGAEYVVDAAGKRPIQAAEAAALAAAGTPAAVNADAALDQIPDALDGPTVAAELVAMKAAIAALQASQGSTGAPTPLKLGGSFSGTLTAE